MSDEEEDFNIENRAESEDEEEVIDTVNIPLPSEELSESDLSEEDETEEELSKGEESPEEQSDISVLSIELKEEQKRLEEAVSPRKSLRVPGYGTQRLTVEFAEPDPNEETLAFLNKIKAIKESLQTSARESSATVKVVLVPVGQEIIMPFKVDTIFKYLKEHFSHLLKVPPFVLEISYAGKILKNNETLIQHGVKPQETIQLELFSTNPDLHPIKRILGLNDVSQIITVTIQTGINQHQVVAVEIIKSDFHKPFLGGFKHKITGIEYHNAGTQTVPKKIPEKNAAFSRDTQTVSERKKLQQTTNTTSTQMTKIGVYVSNMTDKLLKPEKYFSAAEHHARILKAVIVIQTYCRKWHSKVFVEKLKKQKQLKLEWEAQEELKKIKEKEEWMQLDYHRRHNPKKK